VTAPFPPDEFFLRGFIWDTLGVSGDDLDELLDALGLTRRELWIAVVRSWERK